MSFMKRLRKRKFETGEAENIELTLSNWSYLNLELQSREFTMEEYEKLMYIELMSKKRADIVRRLFTRWQKLFQKQVYQELKIEILQNNTEGE